MQGFRVSKGICDWQTERIADKKTSSEGSMPMYCTNEQHGHYRINIARETGFRFIKMATLNRDLLHFSLMWHQVGPTNDGKFFRR